MLISFEKEITDLLVQNPQGLKPSQIIESFPGQELAVRESLWKVLSTDQVDWGNDMRLVIKKTAP